MRTADAAHLDQPSLLFVRWLLVALDPTDTQALSNLAILAWNAGNHEGAIELWERATDRDPEQTDFATQRLAAMTEGPSEREGSD